MEKDEDVLGPKVRLAKRLANDRRLPSRNANHARRVASGRAAASATCVAADATPTTSATTSATVTCVAADATPTTSATTSGSGGGSGGRGVAASLRGAGHGATASANHGLTLARASPASCGTRAETIDWNAVGPRGATALIMVCTMGRDMEAIRQLVRAGADVNFQAFDFNDELSEADKAHGRNGSGPTTPLIAACYEGHARVVHELLDLGADINKAESTTRGGPLYYACSKGHLEVARMLIDRGASVNQVAESNDTAMWVASNNGHTQLVRLLTARGAKFDEQRLDSGETPLNAAAFHGHVEVVRHLANLGADINKQRSDDGSTPISVAAYNGHVDVVNELAGRGADLDRARTDSGATPLWVAANNGHLLVVQQLIDCGVDINKARSDDGTTPAWVACNNGHTEVVRLLASRGADLEKETLDSGEAPLSAAAYHGRLGVVHLLCERGVCINRARVDDGTTPIWVAANNGHAAVVKLLAECGADLERTTKDSGETPVNAAAFHGYGQVVATLCEFGVDLDQARSDDGSTPLIIAAYQGFVGVAQQLAAWGANVHAADAEGNTAHDYATSQGHHELANWLQAVDQWSPLQIAVGCRLRHVATCLLKHGCHGCGSSTQAATTLRAIAATAQAWPRAPPSCQATLALVRRATAPYSTATHWLYHERVRQAVHTVLLVSERLFRRRNSKAQQPGGDGGGTAQRHALPHHPHSKATLLPELPPEMWLYILRFVQRTFWKAPTRKPLATTTHAVLPAHHAAARAGIATLSMSAARPSPVAAVPYSGPNSRL